MNEWGIDSSFEVAGGVDNFNPTMPAAREVTLLQRKTSKLGKNLGKSTGWIHRRALSMRGVTMLGGCEYVKIDVCAGQLPLRELAEPLEKLGVSTQLIGGADVAAELDAKRAINQGTRVAAAL